MSLSKGIKRLTAAALALVLVAAGAAFALPLFISDQDARLSAFRALRAATGAEPRVAGSVSLSLLPRPSVRIEDIRIADAERSILSADALQANVRLLPLLFGHVEIASLTFEGAQLAIDARESGPLRLGLPMRPGSGRAPADLPEIRIVNGTLSFNDGSADRVEPLTQVDAALAWAGAGITASGSFRWMDEPSTFSVVVGDLGALERGERSSLRLRLDGALLKAGFDGGVAYRNGLQADGVIAAETNSLRALLSRSAQPPALPRNGFGVFKFKGQAAIAANTTAIKNLAIELDGNRAEGGLTLKQAEGRTTLQATLASEQADFTPYASGFSMVDESGEDWSRERIDLSGLDALDLDIRFSSSRVQIRKHELTRVAGTATIRNGDFILSVGTARFQNGDLTGRAMISRNALNTPVVKVEGTVSDFDLGPGLKALADIGRIDGKGTLQLSLDATGEHMYALTRDLGGALALTAENGTFSGVNIEQALRRIERNPIAGSLEVRGGRTPFQKFTARLKVANGTARVEEARAESQQVVVNVTGETSVAYRHFDLRGTAMLRQTGKAPEDQAAPFELPFLVRGSWEYPYFSVDPLRLLRRSDGAEAPAVDPRSRRAWLPTVSSAH